MNVFVNILFGHLIGDYFLQNRWMAMKKGGATWPAIVHCVLYTIAICCFTQFNYEWFLFVSITHFLVDRFSLADHYLRLIGSRSLHDFMINGQNDIPENYNKENYHALRGAFTALVYLITDNTLHLLSMYYMYPYLTK